MSRTMPKQRPGKSETVVRTPRDFLKAVKNFLGIKRFDLDLAASDDNAVAPDYFIMEDDSLSRGWARWVAKNRKAQGWMWLNPPYDKIKPWTAKCLAEAENGARIALLVPAAIGTSWWREHIHNQARVYTVGRLYFLDKNGNPIVSPKTGKPTPYPKDLSLVLYGDEPGYDYLDWKEYL
jgi:phage N-6-adenine-methyltransferase